MLWRVLFPVVLLLSTAVTTGAAQCPDGSPPPCALPDAVAPIPIDSQAILILPFQVHGPAAMRYLGEGMIDLFQIALDGVGGFRVVYPRTALRRLRQLADPSDRTQVTHIVRALGAGLVISGSVIGTGPELRVRAELYDAVRHRRVAAVAATGNITRLGSIVDSLASTILKARLITPSEVRRRGLEEYTTRSPVALQSFLVAEQQERRGEWREAAESLQSALTHDSSFGLAYYVLYRITDNRTVTPVPGGADSVLRLGLKYLDRLPQRLQQLFLVADAHAQGQRVRALRLADEAARRFPDDAEVSWHQADQYFHFGLPLGEPTERVAEMFRRALALDDGVPESYDHYVVLLSTLGDTVGAWNALRRSRTLAPRDVEGAAAELAMRAVFRHENPWQLARGIPLADAAVVLDRAQQKALRFLPLELGRGVALADSFAAFLTLADQPRGVRLRALLRRYGYALAQGRYQVAWTYLEEAQRLAPGEPAVAARILLHDLATGGHAEEAKQIVRRLANSQPLPLPLAAVLAWHAVLREPAPPVDTMLATLENRSWPDSARGHALAVGLRGLLALRFGDSLSARMLLTRAYETQARRSGPNAVLFPNADFSFTLAQLERAAGDPSAARRRLSDVYPYHEVLPLLAATEEMRAAISEELGDTTGARIAYGNVVSLWRHADPEFQPHVTRARTALTKLGRQ